MTNADNQGSIRIGACLSLSGKYARFGSQAARALKIWQSMRHGDGELVIEDDRSDPRTLSQVLPRVAANCDILLGPYSTQLMKVAGRIAADNGWLLWNHGGSGDDIEASYPGHIVSLLTPTRLYAVPYIRYLAEDSVKRDLWIVRGKGSFGRQVATGAERFAFALGFDAVQSCESTEITRAAGSTSWDMLSAGTFEDDVEIVRRVRAMARPPKEICSIAAGVRAFSNEVESSDGIFGIAQWFPGVRRDSILGPTEADFVEEYRKRVHEIPDYPAAQAIAAAVIAVHCVEQAGGVASDSLWRAATTLDAQTLFGRFAIEAATGTQVGHETTLVRWSGGQPDVVTE